MLTKKDKLLYKINKKQYLLIKINTWNILNTFDKRISEIGGIKIKVESTVDTEFMSSESTTHISYLIPIDNLKQYQQISLECLR